MRKLRAVINLILTQSIFNKARRNICLRPPAATFFLSHSHLSLSSSAMSQPLKKSLSEWSFSEPKLAGLPLDKETKNFVRRRVPGAVFSLVSPTAWSSTSRPRLVSYSKEAVEDILDLDRSVTDTQEFVDWVSGNMVLEGSVPMAHRYGGYQFGYWAEQLGDGRAHLLGEYVNRQGERWEVQLKGSGRTPYSRFGDGRAVLRSSVREFLCSEAMHHLGVPTSRAASLAVTDDAVPRDMFYDGRLKQERGAVVLRLAPTWFRIGSFEILAMNKEYEELKQLADFVLTNTFPHISEVGEAGYLAMFAEVVDKTALLIAKWMSVGFAHGVLNTDNMSIASITIDYGPFGFIDEYNPRFIPNHSDDMGRYDLENQANIGLWNLDKFATALKPLISVENHGQLEMILKGYGASYQKYHLNIFRSKLGLTEGQDGDEKMIDLLLEIMESIEADYTQTFRDLSELSLEDLRDAKIPESAWGLHQCLKNKKIKDFLQQYCERIGKENQSDEERMQRMQNTNPRYILRNWIAQKAIEMAENDDFSEVRFLLEVLREPYKMNKTAEEKGLAGKPPGWSKRLAVSCSS